MTIKSRVVKPVAAAIGVAFVSSLAITSTASASDNPFDAADLNAGYMLASSHAKGEEGKCGEGKCGAHEGEDKGDEGKCGEKEGEEGTCGEKESEEGTCGEKEDKGEEGSCGGA